MRKPTPASSLARLVAVLFAAPVIAHAFPAAIVTHSFGTTSGGSTGASGITTSTPTVISSPAPAASSGSSGSSSGTATMIAPTNTTKTDQRAAATNDAVQGTRSSANTSASQLRAATTPQPATVSTTPGTTGTGAGSGTGTTTVVGTSLGFPGAISPIVNSGEPAVDVNGNIVGGNAASAVSAPVPLAFVAPQYASADVVFADNTMNQVIGDAKRDRRRVGRNGQLLYSIAPRTNVDRSREMPDDGPSPALAGPLSR